jgi:uncharacterized protein YecA (UPF0149 family)
MNHNTNKQAAYDEETHHHHHHHHTITNDHKIGRNDPCHCGSGKKYKKCCLQEDGENCACPHHH